MRRPRRRQLRLPAQHEEVPQVRDAAIAGDAARPALTEWIGRARVTEEEITLAAARRVAATLDQDPDAPRPGSSLPSHWSGLFFAEVARRAALGPDGHPRKGEFLPPIPLPHRMGAGRRVVLHGGLRVGGRATRCTEVAAIVPKASRSGPICVLTMRNTITARGEALMVEEFDAIHRHAPRQAEGAARALDPPPADEGGRSAPRSIPCRCSATAPSPGTRIAPTTTPSMRARRKATPGP
jgi:3-methylfumaryl-CoA hydratase